MKTTITSPIAWSPSAVKDLDQWLGGFLGNRLYTYAGLMQDLHTDGSGMRARLKEQGWPVNADLQGRIIIGLTGGQYLHVNQGMRTAMGLLNEQPNTFLCPDVDAGDPDEISGTIDGMNAEASKRFICANIQAGKHMETSLNRSSDYKQMIHIWGKSGDFKNTDFSYNYMVIAHGGSLIGWDSDIAKSSSSTYTPDWASAFPLVGARRGVPGYFAMVNQATKQCVDVDKQKYSNGVPVKDYACNKSSDNQQWVYTAEGQLRPKGNNKYCLDISGGSAKSGKAVHIWDCDGQASEKWFITRSGNFNANGGGLVLDLNYGSKNGSYIVYGSNGGSNQTFTLRKVDDWLPSVY